ncbi:MAG: GntR family transcriptional regulator [Deltaproteobacteria bacterium]|nr:GntR family transcriptional regulator [Deltaproteobacteria bacterium]
MEPRRTIIDQIYHQLLERIQLGEIESGERLIETQVAGSLDTSRTPVREAFRRLEQDGIVERLVRRCARPSVASNRMGS